MGIAVTSGLCPSPAHLPGPLLLMPYAVSFPKHASAVSGCLTGDTLIRSSEVCSALRGLRSWCSIQAVLLWITCHSFSLENHK